MLTNIKSLVPTKCPAFLMIHFQCCECYFVTHYLQATILGLSAPEWEVRNAAGLAYTSLTVRVLGVKNVVTYDTARRALTGHEFMTRFPPLHAFLLHQLTVAAGTLATQPTLQPHPSLYPVLILLSRLRASSDGTLDKVRTVNTVSRLNNVRTGRFYAKNDMHFCDSCVFRLIYNESCVISPRDVISHAAQAEIMTPDGLFVMFPETRCRNLECVTHDSVLTGSRYPPKTKKTSLKRAADTPNA